MSTELFNAARGSFGLAGFKAKDVPAVLASLKAEYGVDAAVSSGMLKLTQGDTIMDIGAALTNFREKHPRDFYGSTGDVTFKETLAGDTAGKVAFIREHGYEAWASLPLNEKSLGAKNATTDAIPSSHMKRAEYLRLTIAERTKLSSEIGVEGVQRIMSRR